MAEPWWRSAVIYQIYLRSFADGNGDGIGDLAGVRARLPYLRELGVDALWITPWYPSPMADGGYDVADFRDIDPVFGTLAEAEQLIDEAHRHGLRVIPDIVPNHTSDRHVWFQAALAAGPGSSERARFFFRPGRGVGGDEPPNNWPSRFGGPAWTRVAGPDGAPGEWYLHLYTPEQPDLNWAHPEVRAEFESVLRFWFDRGIDGFRIDVAHGLAKDPDLPDFAGGLDSISDGGHPYRDRDEVQEIYQRWREIADSYPGERTFVAEAWVPPHRMANYVRPGRLHTSFNFTFLRAPWVAEQLREVIDATLTHLGAAGAPATWVLSNHDVPRHPSRYGRAPQHWVTGARFRLDDPLDATLGDRRARAAALLLLALPGGAYVYQGDELGLTEVEDLPEHLLADPIWVRSGHTDRGRDGCRVPIPWSGDRPPFGFGPPGGADPWLPQPAAWAGRTAADQAGEPGSMLELYRAALRIRRAQPALGDGGFAWLSDRADVLDFRREPGFRCIVNLAADPVVLPDTGRVLLSSGELAEGRLPSDTAVWLAGEGRPTADHGSPIGGGQEVVRARRR